MPSARDREPVVSLADRRNAAGDLKPIFSPRSVAVIGAGRDPASISGRLFRNLLASFRGPVYPINPHASEIGSVRAFPTLLDLPEPVDLAFVAVPAAGALAAVRQCVEKRVRGLVVITAGFSEIGKAGTRLERELVELAQAAGIRIVGPNCFGVFNTDPRVQLNGTFGAAAPARGNVGVCTQSGALGVVIPDYLRRRSLGVSTFASIGNKADVNENDLLGYWRDDPATDVIALYLESFHDPREFRRLAGEISRQKPIVVLKAARTSVGARAASSHTAALAGPDRAAQALLRQSGAIRVATLEELFDVTALLAHQPLPAGRSVAILTNAGGPGILCADALAAEGLMLPEFTDELQSELRRFVRPEAAVKNPVDLIASIDAQEFRHCLELLMDSREVDAIITIYVPREPGTSPAVARAVREVAAAWRRPKTSLAVFMQTDGLPGELIDQTTQIPGYIYPEPAARALAHAVRCAEARQRPTGRVPEFPDIQVDVCRAIASRALTWSGRAGGWLRVEDTQRLLAALNVAVPRWKIVRSADEAAAAADGWQSSVVVKVVSPTVLHKTDCGGVVVNASGGEAVRRAYQLVTTAVADAAGALVQEFVPGGHEMLVGATRDAQFGHVLACGLGGTSVELADDIACGLHPLTDLDADEMLHSVRASKLLAGYRGRPAADAAALKETLLRISALLTIAPEIAEIDLNPVKVLRAGSGTCALDCRVRVAGD